MTLDAEVVVRLGDFELDVAVHAEAGTTTAVLGPNGAGKTTLLRALAGLVPLHRSHVVLAGDVLDDTTVQRRRSPQERRIGMVFQQHLLFPSMSVRENVAFGLRARGVPKEAARARAGELLEAVGLAAKASARPDELSGGQSQRVALARALATDPDLLLLDEPLAALDVGTRADVRRELAAHLEPLSCVRLLVTHDPVDALALADHVIVLEAGQVTQSGPIDHVTTRPTTSYVADLMGLNLFRGDARDGSFTFVDGTTWQLPTGVDGPAFASVHPRHVHLDREPPSGRIVGSGTVTAVEPERDRTLVRLAAPWPIAVEAPPSAARAVRPGERVGFSVDPAGVSVYDRAPDPRSEPLPPGRSDLTSPTGG